VRIRYHIHRTRSENEQPQKKSAWHYFFVVVLIIMFAITTVSMQGCAAPKSREHLDILQWQAEGQHVYKVENGVEYFVRCDYGLKYLGTSRTNEVIGPIDTCKGE